MKTYKKRVAFLISTQHFIPHGGIGSFCKSFAEMGNRLGWKVDVILDKSPSGNFDSVVKDAGANVLWPTNSLRYSDHTATFAFSDSINFEKIINFRTALIDAFKTNIYDLIVCNTQEAMTAAYALTFSKYIPVVFYTHSADMIFRDPRNYNDIFLESYNNFYNKHMELPDIIVGTQSQLNVDELTKYGTVNCKLLRMPLSERALLESSKKVSKKGVLFIGRWEERKNPEAFIKVIKESGLPAKVMTNSTGAKKFEARFEKEGITDYEIKIGVVGQEKVDFIKGCKVFFMPSLGENYPFAFSECLGHMPCVVLDKQTWSNNFDSKYFHKVSLNDAASTIKKVYDQEYSEDALKYVNQLETEVENGWVELLSSFAGKKSTTNAAKINSFDTVTYADYIKGLDRTNLAREDIESVLANKHKFTNIIYTDKNSYLSKDSSFVPEENSIDDLFE